MAATESAAARAGGLHASRASREVLKVWRHREGDSHYVALHQRGILREMLPRVSFGDLNRLAVTFRMFLLIRPAKKPGAIARGWRFAGIPLPPIHTPAVKSITAKAPDGPKVGNFTSFFNQFYKVGFHLLFAHRWGREGLPPLA